MTHEHKVGLIVDEWGTWYDVEPGTNPGFLYQQNSMRDAMVASLTLDIFNAHSDRVIMANIAQTVNVLQAVILTEGDKMVLTPTYHVFDMYKAHHEATLLGTHISCESVGMDENMVSQLSATASEKDGVITLTVTNTSADESTEAQIELFGTEAANISARILTEKMDAYNDFDSADKVTIKEFNDFDMENGKITIKMPACSIVALEIK